jgi:hypothetical protein
MRTLYYKLYRRRRVVFGACVLFALVCWFTMTRYASSRTRLDKGDDLKASPPSPRGHDHAEHEQDLEEEMRRHFDDHGDSNRPVEEKETVAEKEEAAVVVDKLRINMNNYKIPEPCRQCPGEGGRPVYLSVSVLKLWMSLHMLFE